MVYQFKVAAGTNLCSEQTYLQIMATVKTYITVSLLISVKHKNKLQCGAGKLILLLTLVMERLNPQ